MNKEDSDLFCKFKVKGTDSKFTYLFVHLLTKYLLSTHDIQVRVQGNKIEVCH